jgi:hypothetical protein
MVDHNPSAPDFMHEFIAMTFRSWYKAVEGKRNLLSLVGEGLRERGSSKYFMPSPDAV